MKSDMSTPGAQRHGGLCVLTLHRVVETCERDHDIAWTSFRGLLDTIATQGLSVDVHLASAESLRTTSVALTFDDGTADHMRVGEELASRGMTGIFFVSAGMLGRPGRLVPQDLRALCSLGHVVGSHGVDHLALNGDLSPDEVARELGDSKKLLEDHVRAPIVYFAPPGGFACASMADGLQRHGYVASRSMRWGIYRLLRDRWRIPCIPVTEFTLARGWVAQAASAHTLPLAMRSAWAVKSLTPGPVRFAIRRMLHTPFAAHGGPR